MRDEFLKILGVIVIGLGITIGLLASVQMLSATTLWSEQGAAWVQAVGSIVAIGSAVWMSNRDRIERHRNAETIGVLAAAEHWTELRSFSEGLTNVGQRLKHAEQVESGPTEWAQMLSIIEARPLLDSAVVMRFSGLGKDCAIHLAYANADLHATARYIQQCIVNSSFEFPQLARSAGIKSSCIILERALRHMNDAMVPIAAVVDGGANQHIR